MREAARLANYQWKRMICQQEFDICCSQRLLVNRQLSASSNFIASRETSLHVHSLASVTCYWIGGNYMLVSWTRKNSDPRKFPELGSPLTLSLCSQAGIAWDRRAMNLISISPERLNHTRLACNPWELSVLATWMCVSHQNSIGGGLQLRSSSILSTETFVLCASGYDMAEQNTTRIVSRQNFFSSSSQPPQLKQQEWLSCFQP